MTSKELRPALNGGFNEKTWKNHLNWTCFVAMLDERRVASVFFFYLSQEGGIGKANQKVVLTDTNIYNIILYVPSLVVEWVIQKKHFFKWWPIPLILKMMRNLEASWKTKMMSSFFSKQSRTWGTTQSWNVQWPCKLAVNHGFSSRFFARSQPLLIQRFQGRSSLLAEQPPFVARKSPFFRAFSHSSHSLPTFSHAFPMVFPCFSDQRSFPPAVRGQLLRLGLGSHWLVPRPCAGLHHPETSNDFFWGFMGELRGFWGRFQMVTWMGLNRIFDRSLMGYVYNCVYIYITYFMRGFLGIFDGYLTGDVI